MVTIKVGKRHGIHGGRSPHHYYEVSRAPLQVECRGCDTIIDGGGKLCVKCALQESAKMADSKILTE
jgi:hypothetical protein